MRTPPVPGHAETAIEDFFDAGTKAIKVDGKSFHPVKGFDKTLHYGKTVFAHKVVRPNADTINFAGFEPLLATIVAVIAQHASASSGSSMSSVTPP
jgi:RNA-directed DNA polymerase